MRSLLYSSRALCLVAVVSLALAQCAINPATGRRQLALIGEGREVEMGREADQEISVSMGLYQDEELTRYVDGVGQRLAATSERSHLDWTFRVIDDAAVNAFALPGGFVYVTRGILAHMSSEAELAGVLGHEIGHVTGRHSVNRLSKAQLGGLVLGVGSAVAEAAKPGWAGVLETGAQVTFGLAFSKFSRDHERQADDLGLRYMVRASYDPRQMPGVFAMLEAVSSQAEGGRAPSWMATHPNPESRGRRSVAAVSALGNEVRGRVGAEEFLRRLDGMTFGADPREGYFRESLFLHPEMRFQLSFPTGWRTRNQKTGVVAVNSEGNVGIQLTLADARSAGEGAREFLGREGLSAGRPWARSINGLVASGGGWTAESQGTVLAGEVMFVEHGGSVFQIVGYGSGESFEQERSTVRDAARSFRPLRDPRVLAVEPFRLEVIKLETPSTLGDLAKSLRSPVDVKTLAVVNRRTAEERIPAGSLVKIVVGEPID